EALEVCFAVLVVDADAALDRDRHAHARPHGRDRAGDEVGLRHQAGAEASLLHPVRRTADIEVDLVVAIALADGRRLRELGGVRATELQGYRVLPLAEA